MAENNDKKNAFKNAQLAEKYSEYLQTVDGKFQQKILLEAIKNRLSETKNGMILDAACGTGWLTDELRKLNFSLAACDSSEQLLAIARAQFPKITFTTADVTQPLPYQPNSFTSVILNMAAQDIHDLSAVYTNIAESLVADGRLIVTIPNPYCTFPNAVWKRGILSALFGKKPILKFADKKLVPMEGKPVSTYRRDLSEYVNEAVTHGLVLTHLQELRSDTDSKNFGLQYQLYRYPLLLLLEFKKIV